MKDFFQNNPFGKLIRRLGIYAAGAIPFVGAFATVVAQWADTETFSKKITKSSAPAPVAQKTTAQPAPTQATVADPLFTSAAPPSAVTGESDLVSGSGLDSWFPKPTLPGSVDVTAPDPGKSLMEYMVIGFAVIIGIAILVSFVGRK